MHPPNLDGPMRRDGDASDSWIHVICPGPVGRHQTICPDGGDVDMASAPQIRVHNALGMTTMNGGEYV